MMQDNPSKPLPGSPQARVLGCLCNSNFRGKGWCGIAGIYDVWDFCRLHGTKALSAIKDAPEPKSALKTKQNAKEGVSK